MPIHKVLNINIDFDFIVPDKMPLTAAFVCEISYCYCSIIVNPRAPGWATSVLYMIIRNILNDVMLLTLPIWVWMITQRRRQKTMETFLGTIPWVFFFPFCIFCHEKKLLNTPKMLFSVINSKESDFKSHAYSAIS